VALNVLSSMHFVAVYVLVVCDQTATWNSENDLDGLALHGKYSLYSSKHTATWNSENDLDGFSLHGKYSLYALVTKLRPGSAKLALVGGDKKKYI